MAVPVISNLPPAPTRADGSADFSSKADALAGALQPMVVQVNIATQWMAGQLTEAQAQAAAAAASALAAANSATAANASKNAAAQSAIDATNNGAAQVTLANAARSGAEAARDTAQIYAAAAGSAVGIPALAGKARKPLTPNAALDGAQWSDEISIPKYIDKVATAVAPASYQMDLSAAAVYDLTLSVNTALSIVSMPVLSGESLTIVVRIRQSAAPKTLTWFSGISWLTPGGVVPATPSASQIVEYVLSTAGTGSSWIGRVGAST